MWGISCVAGARGGGGANSFVTVEGRGVGVTESGDIWYDVGSTDPIRVTARSGWLVNGRESVTLDPSSGTVGGLDVTSRLQEDSQHIHVFPCVTDNAHVRDIVIGAQTSPSRLVAMYAVPEVGTVVSASASKRVVVKGLHHVTRRYSPCACGESMPGSSCEEWDEEVVPDRYEWVASAAGPALGSSTWTGTMTKGLGQAICFNVTGKRDACPACECHAHATAEADVYELSIERPDYLGLDLTDAMRNKYVKRTATAKIDPEPTRVAYSWTNCGRCDFIDATDASSVTYGGNDKTGGSESFLVEPLTVSASVWNRTGQSATASCTTNFTVVAVDVSVDGAGEGTEEASPPSVIYSRELTRFAIDNMKPVKIVCEPKNLPDTELVWLTLTDNIDLYEKNESGVPVRVTKSFFRYNEIGGKTFGLLGRPPYEEIQDGVNGTVKAEHYASGAKDLAKVKVVPPPPLEITNVQFLSPSSKNKGAWPYDPVWDDDDWKLTVNGSLAEYCATDPDDATVKYTLSRDAKKVDIEFRDGEWSWADTVDAIEGPTSGGCNEKQWEMPAYLDEGSYHAKVIVLELETDEARTAKSNDGKLVRECYYRSFDVPDAVKIPAIGVSDAEVDLLREAVEGLFSSVDIATDVATLKASFWVSAIISGAKHSGIAGLDIPKWLTYGMEIAQYTWHVTKFEWNGESYVVPPPTTTPLGNKGASLVERSEFEMRYVKIGRPSRKDNGDLVTVWLPWFHCGEVTIFDPNNLLWKFTPEGPSGVVYPEDGKEWKWEPKPKEGHGLRCPKLRCPKCCKDEQSKE